MAAVRQPTQIIRRSTIEVRSRDVTMGICLGLGTWGESQTRTHKGCEIRQGLSQLAERRSHTPDGTPRRTSVGAIFVFSYVLVIQLDSGKSKLGIFPGQKLLTVNPPLPPPPPPGRYLDLHLESECESK